MYTVANCFRCEELREDGLPEEEISEAHANCHGWFHCGSNCCGPCGYCGDESEK